MKLRIFFAAFAVLASIWLMGSDFTLVAHAQVDTGLEAVGQTIALPDTDPRILAARIINIFLGLLGIILLVIILYAGFLWMTAGGKQDQITKAKAWLRNGIIGLIIVLSSWAIASFAINSLINAATGGAGGGGSGGGGSGGGGGFGTGGGDVFRIMAKSPEGSVGNADLVIRVLFNRDVDETTIGAFSLSPQAGGSWTIDPTNAKRVIFTPTDPCPGAPQKGCFAFDTQYTVTVSTDLRSLANQQLRCGGFYPDCTFTFTSGNTVDNQSPAVKIMNLFNGKSVPVNSAVEVLARATDDIGISGMDFEEGGQIFGSEGPTTVPSPATFEASSFWDTVGKTLKQTYTITVRASDLDTNTGQTSVNVIVLDQHCFDTIQNNDETGVDCGGADCLSCNGGQCQENSQCASGMCVNGVCVEQPIITDVKPLAGKEGTYVSVWGYNFGDAGSISFMGPPEVVASAPQACVTAGALTWSNNYALVEVPAGAATGPLKITNTNSTLTDTTADERGPEFIFEVNNQEVPGLCSVNPNNGLPGAAVQLTGANLGASGGSVRFGNTTPAYQSWSATVINFLAPVATPGLYPVWIANQAGIESNKVPFTVKSTTAPQPAPVITFIDPAQGPRGQYITIVGERFGSVPGVVRFYDKAADKTYTGDAAFPQGCAAGWWKNNNIVIKVPSVDTNVVKPAQFSIYIERSDSIRSNGVDFTYTDGTAGPGICAINPSAGPVGTYVELHGENLGSAASGNQVVFANGQPADIQSWQTNKIDITVPAQAITGSVFATVSGSDTNSMQFAVADCRDDSTICSQGQTCCPNGTCVDGSCSQQSFSALYGWQFSTGIIPKAPRVVEFCDPAASGTQLPSPTPYINHKGGDQVCVSAKPVIGVLFDMPIQWPPAQNPGNLFSLKKCTGTGADPCSSLEDVAITVPNMIAGGDPYVYFQSVNNLEPSTTYYVFVNREIRSADLQYGTTMDENTACPEPGLGYCYRFRTRSDTGPCAVGKVYVNPWRAYVEGNEEQNFEALPAIQNAECTMVDCAGFDFNWSTDPISKAWMKSSLTPFACKQTVVSGDQEAVNPPVKVSAVESSSNQQGLADLFIQYIVPKVVDQFPECDTACSNIVLWAQMNTSLWSDPPPAGLNTVELPDPIKPGNYYKNVKVFRCATENCFDAGLSEISIKVKLEPQSPVTQYQSIPYSFISITPIQDLARGTYYKVWLNGGAGTPITTKHGVALPEPVSWQFRTRLDNEQCQPDSVQVLPGQKIQNRIYDRQLFTAKVFSQPDDCRVDGQMLKINQAFDWSFTDPAQQVASYLIPSIDTGAVLPPGCSSNCLARGSNGVFGKIAVCGNNVVETTDPNYCQGGTTPAGQSCVLLPMESGAGEQCDGGPLCSINTCLLQPVSGPTCGNGVVDYSAGEMCDPSTRCFDAVNDPALEGTVCLSQTLADACVAAGGTCEKRDYQGCSVNCRNMGSSSEPTSFCGNGGTPGAGEDCDLGADNGKSGCSNNCLHIGSSPSVVSVCGNGVLEAGETCEAPAVGQPLPAWCDSVRCIKLGNVSCASPTSPGCCGNNVIDDGEECDDGNKIAGDGCGIKCLFEGSSWKYPTPSFCGDGIVGTGELCESVRHTTGAAVNNAVAGIGDGLSDPVQLAVIDPGLGTPDPVTKVIQIELACTYSGVTGNAIYGVGCGKTKESDCEPGFGLDANGCCAPRPAFTASPAPFPSGNNNNQGFCRNVLIEVNFAEAMDIQSVLGNFTIAKEIAGNDCPAGSTPLALNEPSKGFWGWVANKWHELVSWVKGEPAYALYCTNTVPGTLVAKGTSTTAFVYRLSQALEPDTNYIIRFEADPKAGSANDDNQKQGIRTKRGVVGFADAGDNILQNNWQYTWWFKTGNDICRADTILIEDVGKSDPAEDYSPFYFAEAFEEHLFIATAQSIKNGSAQSIAPIQGLYEWLWQPWVINNPEIALTNDDTASYTQPATQSAIRVSDKSGYAWVFSSLKITVDTLGPNSTAGSVVSNSKPITVFICDNPWPPRLNSRFEPFRDADNSIVLNYSDLWLANLYSDLYTAAPTGPFFNFQTIYCRDHENGVMPSINPKYIPLSQSDSQAGILRQYLFTYEEAAYKSDGIGIRVYKNPYKDTPLEWYRRQGFLGNPQSIIVDGYPAIRDGGTVYIGFPNTYSRNESIYPNILVMSHNIGASPVTERIFDSLLSNFAFNINFNFDNGNVCVEGGETGVSSGEVYVDPATGGPVVCVSDYDCLKVDNSPDPKLRCSSFKYKLQHDIKRLADFKDIQKSMDAYYGKNGRYPVLAEGSYQKTRTNSLWPSWQETLGAELGITMPIDPVNRLITCGLCKPSNNPAAQSTIPCATSNDCAEGYFCEAQDGFDPATCWSADLRQFMCPYMAADGSQPVIEYSPYGADEPFAPSRFYSYRSFDGGKRFELGANFEISPMAYIYSNGNPQKTDSWWEAPYFVELRYCKTANPISNGRWCTSNDDCKPCMDPASASCTEPAPANSCQPAGFRYQFKNICNNDTTGDSSVCGDKVKGMVCSDGPKVYQACSGNADCDGFACEYEFCELGDTKLTTCDYSSAGAQDGFMLTVCEDCKRYVTDPILSICQPKLKCGNGRIDGYCGGVATANACTKDADCADGVACVLQETCDDGILNGTYGHCNVGCTGYDKYCGDGQLSPGEICDRGSDITFGNGAYCAAPSMCYAGTSGAAPLSVTCGLGCQGIAPYCGDAKTNGPEQCDGQVARTISAICSDGPRKEMPCQSDADCPDADCGPSIEMTASEADSYESCADITQSRCAGAAQVCLTDAEASALQTGVYFKNNPTAYQNYQLCTSDAGCSANEKCISLSLGIECLNDAQCSNTLNPGVCREYGTEHVRSCQAPGTVNQCKWEPKWSICKIAHFCGDGVIDQGEECDDGSNNAINKACLPTCKKNICGDGYMQTNVEECDHGSNNGKNECDASYGSTCNDCSLQCKIVAMAGGYCGNGIKEPGEQCDGNILIEPKAFTPVTDYIVGADLTATDASSIASKKYIGTLCENPPCQVMQDLNGAPTDLTCQQLGYDFASNSDFNTAILVTDWTEAEFSGGAGYVPKGAENMFWYEAPGSIVSGFLNLTADTRKNNLLNKILWDCDLLHDVDPGTTLNLQWKPQDQWPTPFDFRQCVNLYGINNGFRMVSDANSKPACSTDCKPASCGRCSDEVGDGEIFGYVMDRIWLQPVPTARVTLQYRGVNVDQTMTDQNGKFIFKNLSTRGDCNQFRLVIDKYDNNICTELSGNRPAEGCLRDMALSFDRAVDEGKNGGYWSYTTENFSIENFPYKEMLGMIYIYPRPAKGEGYVTYGRPQLFTDEAWQRVKDCQNSGDKGCLLSNVSASLPWTKFWAPHIVWPENQARLHPWSGSGVLPYSESAIGTAGWDLCTYDQRGLDTQHSTNGGKMLSCARDYNWMNQGSLNLSAPPYAGMACPSLLWDFDKTTGCPVAGTTLCKEQCITAKGFWSLIYDWTGMTFSGDQCDAYCKVGTSCPATVPASQLTAFNKCHLGVNNAQTTGFFRYQDVLDLNEPINIYFSGGEYEPIRGEYYYTAPLTSAEFDAWSRETNPQKPAVYASLPDLPVRALSWREVWAKTNVKVYVTTDKGIYAITPTGGNTRADFRRPFWHIASIGTNGEVGIANSWRSVADLDLPKNSSGNFYYPDTPLFGDISDTKTALRPQGMGCWNMFGAACQQVSGMPWTLSCLANQDKGILNYFAAANAQQIQQNSTAQQNIWTLYFSRQPVVNDTAVCGINESAVRYNAINW